MLNIKTFEFDKIWSIFSVVINLKQTELPQAEIKFV